jgi:hypothetical protein
LDDDAYQSTATAANMQGDYNALIYTITQILNRKHTATLVQVVSVTNTGTDAAVGFVSVQPLINQTDGYGNAIPHSILSGVPYFRMQGGANAIILDPQKGDIGLAVFVEKDISKVVANSASASSSTAGTPNNPLLSNPDSNRRFSMSDGVYFGGFLNGIPTQYVQFSATGITLVSPNLIELQATDIKLVAPTIELNATSSVTVTTPTFTVNGNAVVTGSVAATGDVTTAVGGGHSLTTHHHQVVNVQTGSSTINTGTTV